jgi:TetR/AcrR family transcriptional repressor of nem operon
MKVTKAQVQANRARVVETASLLFRERGYDGVGIADLMSAAGLTHGGFYKHFASKSDLIAESAACGLAQTAEQSAGVDIAGLVKNYLSREHRDDRTNGCTIAALSGDAARQSDAVRATFAAGIEDLVAVLSAKKDSRYLLQRGELLDLLAHAVGALVMSRACPDDSPLADEILAACRERILDALTRSVAGDKGK